jgi:LemA protein
MSIWWIVAAVIALLLISVAISYNRFVSQRTLVRNAWSNIDTELKRRYDLIPNLVATVKGYAAHEREILEAVARARAGAILATGSPAQQAAAEAPLVGALRQLYAVVENYPQLKADKSFMALTQELENTEDRIQAARRLYNANVETYNRRVSSFPSMIIARICGFKDQEFFQIDPAVRGKVERPPDIDFGSPTAPRPPMGAPASVASDGGREGPSV